MEKFTIDRLMCYMRKLDRDVAISFTRKTSPAPVPTISLTLRTDVVVIQHILFHILDADLGKASFAQQLLRLVSAPHCSETLTTEGQ